MAKFFKETIVLILFLLPVLLFSQANVQLNEMFKNYEIFKIDSRKLYDKTKAQRNGGNVQLTLNDELNWDMHLYDSKIISANYVLTEVNEHGVSRRKGTNFIPMTGTLNGKPGSRVSLTFGPNFIYGFIDNGKDIYYIEPLVHFQENASLNDFICYNTKDIIPNSKGKCGYELYQNEVTKYREAQHSHHNGQRSGQCFSIDIAIAADYSMFQHYGSVSGVEGHNIGVLNDVQTNYDDDFDDELQFVLTENWVSSCSTCDPWTSSTDSGALLNSFTNWAPSGFSGSHAVGSLWSRRDFDGSTIGLAWVGAVCTSYGYNVLQDFSSNASYKRVLQAHEIGHNFNASHNTDIMAPSVSNSNSWSNISKSEIPAYYQGIGCLGTCTPITLPVADFDYVQTEVCDPTNVDFYNNSINATSYLWTFEGGNPATSTDENVSVNYLDPGNYNVTLEASNGTHTSTSVKTIYVDVIHNPIVEFYFIDNDFVVDFYFNGQHATWWEWNFGDGSPFSNLANPQHIYSAPGLYYVTLTAGNDCGQGTVTYEVYIDVLPIIDFSANIVNTCNPDTITFTNNTAYGDSYVWTFEGGNPATSTAENPVVIYNTPGVYNVKLIAFNVVGSDSLIRNDYITINPTPIAGFDFTVQNAQVTFTSTAQHATSISWDFGDGTTGTGSNPVHVYTDNGTYNVIQTVTSGCGSVSMTRSVTIAIAPIPSFTSNYSSPICQNDSISFTSTSTYSPTTYLWTFEGGTPATSTEANPIIKYVTAGTFNVTLKVTNAHGSNELTMNDFVQVNPNPLVSFTALGDGYDVTFTQNIQFEDSHLWNFGDGQTSTADNPVHTYSAEGTYPVLLTGTNACGTAQFTRNVLVQLAPTAGFEANDTLICAGQSVDFWDRSSPSTTSWNWSFEGGTPSTSTAKNPVVTYAAPGTYNVSLIVQNSSGQGTLTINDYIEVVGTPTASFTGNVIDNVINLINTGSGATDHDWHIFNDSHSVHLSGTTASFTAPENGTYNVVLKANNMCGEAVSDTSQYIVDVYPVASFSVNGGNGACAETPVNFNGGSSAFSYQWTFEGGTPTNSTLSNPSVQYSGPGTYGVTLIKSNTFGSDTLITTIIVGSLPTAGFTFATNDSRADFVYNGQGQTSVSWNFGDGTNSSELNPVHFYTKPGDYTVTLISTNSCGNDTLSQVITILTTATQDFNDEFGIKVFPNPTTGLLKVSFTTKESVDFEWTIASLAGHVLRKAPVSVTGNQVVTIDLSDLRDGLYLLYLTTEKRTVPYKIFIIR
ncbi:MAG: PKD domain-containing protein [Saprospiraceae bacterium]|nr:MAG: PKD domain-containing protein [Bacteroidetes bacterium OLB9]MCO6462665.1 PKD domain-containing protein [Saprospiraceae bacterium]